MGNRWSRAAVLVVGAAAVLVVGTTGGAVAGHLVTSAQIKDHTIRGKDVHANTLGYGNLTPKARRQLRGRKGATGAPGSALGWVTIRWDGSVINHGGRLAAPTVTHPAPGVYCLRGGGWADRPEAPYALTVEGGTSFDGSGTVDPNAGFDAPSCAYAADYVEVSITDTAGTHKDADFMLAKLG